MYRVRRLIRISPAILIALLLAAPLITILISLAEGGFQGWQRQYDADLLQLIWNTLRLGAGVGTLTFLLGTSLAWIVVMYSFPGRKFLEWALLLPLSIPSYVIGFVFIEVFEYSGVVPTFLRTWIGPDLTFPPIRSYGGVVVVMSCVLYPYVYLFARTAFKEQSVTLLEAARGFGIFPHQIWKIALPIARPSIIAGVSLVLMESLADFGMVSIFSYDTFTTEIYETWFGSFERNTAMQMAGMLVFFSFLLFWLENKTRGKAQYYQTHGPAKKAITLELKGWKRRWIILYPASVFMITFVFPISVLVYWSLQNYRETLSARFFEFAGNTLKLGMATASLVVLLALSLAYFKRRVPGRFSFLITRFATLGYALPGTVIAVGALIPLSSLDHFLNYLTESIWGFSIGLVLTGSTLGVVFALSSRFITIGFNSIDASLVKITPSMDMAARGLGESTKGVIGKVHVPLIRSGILTAFILVLVDVMKEMPVTVILRPFGFETLATWIWQLTSEGLMTEAAIPALVIVLVGLIPTSLFFFFGEYKKR